jgi:uncharacterized repeat protein (TIGR01451 family)
VGTYGALQTSDEDDAYYIGLAPEIAIDKQVAAVYGAGTLPDDDDWRDSVELYVGGYVFYRFIVWNAGNVPLSGVEVTDEMLGGVVCDIGELAVDAPPYVCQMSEPIGPVEYQEGRSVVNTAIVNGCYNGFCDDDEDTASYKALYWAFTPGFWKNHWGNPERNNQNDAWQYTAYDPEFARLCGDAFSAACLYPDICTDSTLLRRALTMQGGSGVPGAVEILLRAGTAALLNASFHETLDVDGHPVAGVALGEDCELQGPDGICYYPLAVQTVIADVNSALTPETDEESEAHRARMLKLAEQLDGYNNGIHEINWEWPPVPVP